MLVRELCAFLDNRFPRALQEGYDNSGDQIVFPDERLNGILIALDISPRLIRHAADSGFNCILTHHPLFFRAIKSIVSTDPFDAMICTLVEKKISHFSLHTNLDRVYHAMPAEILGYPVESELIKGDGNSPGMGTMSILPEAILFRDVLDNVIERLKLPWLHYSGDMNKQVGSIAILNGSGGRFIEKELPSLGADCIITGDIGYHAWRIAEVYGTAIIDAGHFGTEKLLLNFLYGEIQDFLTKHYSNHDVQLENARESDPVHLYQGKK